MISTPLSASQLAFKKTIQSLTLLAAIALLWSLPARGENSGFYLKLDTGAILTQDTDLKVQYPGYSPFGRTNLMPSARIHFDPGARLGLACGYNIADWVAVEAQVAGMFNTVGSLPPIRVTAPSFRIGITGAELVNVPVLFNLKLQYPNRTRWTPYAGAGLGFSESIYTGRSTLAPFAAALGYTGADTVFAYQAFVGLRYKLSKRVGVAVEYRYFCAESPEWSFGWSTFMMDKIQTHAFCLALDYCF